MYHYIEIASNNFYLLSHHIIYVCSNFYPYSHIVAHMFLLAAAATAAVVANQYTLILVLIGTTYMIQYDSTDRNCHTALQPPKENRIIYDTI